MTLYDLDTRKTYGMIALYREWQELLKEEPYNHSAWFAEEWHEYLMATINGRNDMDITGYTGKEISNIILRIRKYITEKEGE